VSARRIETGIAVIGAGPAGLAAATAAARAGARVTVLDAFPDPGGQYWMQAPGTPPASLQMADGARAIAVARAAGVEILTGTELFAAYPGFRLFAAGEGGAVAIAARALVVASGAHDRVVAFPGWTLPGVMTAGAGQRLAKLHGVLPGRRIVLAGSGAFLLAVAESLLAKGAEIAALVEARRPSAALARHLASHPERWRETARLVATARRGARRIVFGRIVVAAGGQDRVESVRLAAAPGGPAEEIDGIDALLVGYGFQPAIDTTAMLGCDHRFDDALGGWHVAADPATGLTSVAGLYAAGEVLGVAGARPALLSGEIAGLSAAAALGRAVDRARLAACRRALVRARAFGHGLGRLFAPPPGLERLADDDTIVCRCEEVRAGEIRAACAAGAGSAYAAKIWTRAGMGRCQGRICRMSLTRLVAAETGRGLEAVGFNRPRVPLRPVPLTAVLAAMQSERQP
jgi:NADPH-dependent 2,4-dienoyl-CoA reductase/sulfur reductase-like enzyme